MLNAWLARDEVKEKLRLMTDGAVDPNHTRLNLYLTLCYLDCPVGALYWAVDGASLRLIGQHALGGGELMAAFNSGEGLVGQAALRPEITVVAAPAGQLRLRSGVAEGSPRAIGLVPLLRAGKITGILELASLEPWKDRSSELLLSVRETLVIAFRR